MIFKRIFTVTVLILLLSYPLYANTNKEEEAIKSADSWLSLVDAEKYTDSWDNTSQYFKSAITKNQWLKSLNSVRKPLGIVISRKLIIQQYTTSLPGAPDGEYVVLQYETTFKNKASSIETLTPSLEKDGVWRVSGYFIK